MNDWKKTFTVTQKQWSLTLEIQTERERMFQAVIPCFYFEYFWLNAYKPTVVYTSVHILRKIFKIKIFEMKNI